jgi:hypothetical protein
LKGTQVGGFFFRPKVQTSTPNWLPDLSFTALRMRM